MALHGGAHLEAVVLAAGPGKRFMNLTKYIPKPLLPVANKPIIERLLRNLKSAGVESVIIVVGHLGHKVIKKVNMLKGLNLKVRFVKAKNYLKGPIFSFSSVIDEISEKNFILASADSIISSNTIRNLIETNENKITLVVGPYARKGTKIYIGSDQEVKGINTPLRDWRETATSMGIMYATSKFLEYVKKAIKRGNTRIVDAINIAIKEGVEIKALYVKEKWFDIDNIQSLLEANIYYLEKLPPASKKPEIPDVKIYPPVLLEDDIKVDKNCEIGPYVCVDRKVQIGENCKLKNIVVLEGSKIPPKSSLSNGVFFKNTFLMRREGNHVQNKS